MKLLNIEVQIAGGSYNKLNQHLGSLIVPNHISYLDIIVLQSMIRAKFVTSKDIGESKFLGNLCKIGGCLFVNRKSKRDLLLNIDEISMALNKGSQVVLFPEGTTSPGNRILPYKSSLLEAAIRSRCAVIPLGIRYLKVDGNTLCTSLSDQIAWYGDMAFFPHLWNLMKIRSLVVQISFGPPVSFRHHRCRKLLTKNLEEITSHLLSE